MKIKIAIALFALFAVNAFAAPARRAPLALQVRYSSIGTGIESELQRKIESLLVMPKIDHSIQYIRESGWGMEGESTTCIQFIDFTVANKILGQVIALAGNSRLTKVTSVLSCDPNDQPKPNE